jgi:hypothetical protein
MKDSIKPVVKLERTNANNSTQSYTYNQDGFTYNEIGWEYGGRYEHDVKPIIASASVKSPRMVSFSVKPNLKVQRTNRDTNTQTYTYNEAGFSYNQSGWEYGGLFNHDIYPLIAQARMQKPSIVFGKDFGSTILPPPPTGNSGMLIGMLGMTYP